MLGMIAGCFVSKLIDALSSGPLTLNSPSSARKGNNAGFHQEDFGRRSTARPAFDTRDFIGKGPFLHVTNKSNPCKNNA